MRQSNRTKLFTFTSFQIYYTETFPMTSHVYTMNNKKNSFVNIMIVFVPLFGAFALLAIICFLGVTLGKKYNKFMKETKKVPEELVSFLICFDKGQI